MKTLSSFLNSAKHLSVLLVLLIVLGGGMHPGIAQAQTAQNTGTSIQDTFDQLKNVDVGDDPSKSFLDVAGTAAHDLATSNPLPALGAVSSGFFGLLYDASRGLLALFSYIVFQLASLILGFAGVAFNYAVVYLVFQFATTLGNSPGMLVAWGVLRDFSNIIFLFGFIFMGVITILDLHSYPVQKTLPKFLIAAVLINFSLLGVSAVIDLSNVLAAAMYNQSMGTDGECIGFTAAGGQVSGGVGNNACKEKNALNVGIAGKILEVSRTSTALSGYPSLDSAGFFFSPNNSTASSSNPIQITLNAWMNDKTKLALTLFMLALFVMTAAIVLIAGTVLLVGRAIVLAFCLVASPILVIGMVIPPLKKQAQQYWSTLLNNALFAPIFLLLIFVSLKIAEGVGNTLGGGNLVDAFTSGDVSLMGGLMVFILIIGFLIGSLVAAKQFSILFADKVNTAAFSALTLAGDQLWNTGTLPYRLLYGTIGAKAREQERKNRANPKFATSLVGAPLTQALGAVGGALQFKTFPKGGIVSRYAGATLAKQLGVKTGDGHGGGAAGGHGGGGGHEEENPYLKSLTDEDKAKLRVIDTNKKRAEQELKELDEKIENARYRGDTAAVEKHEKEKAAAQAKLADLEKERRDLVLTDTQKETYARLEAQGKEKAAEYMSGIEQAQKDQRNLEATLPGLDNEIAALEERIANPEYQGDEQQRDVARLAELRERAARTRSEIAEKAATVVRLQGELTKHENDSTKKLADYVGKAADEYKERRIREYTDSQARYVNFNETWNPFADEQKLAERKNAIAKLRADGLKSGVEKGWDHLKHEIQHAAEHTAKKELDPVIAAAEQRAAAAENALKNAQAGAGGGTPSGGGDHGGGDHH